MSNDLNQCTFIGRAGKDCELRFMPNGNPVATFPLAVGRSWKDNNGEKKEETSWLNIVVFGKLAELVAAVYVTRGKQLLVSGRLRVRKYQDRDGNDKYSTEIIADNLQLLGSKSDSQPAQQNNQQQNQGGHNQPQQQDQGYQNQKNPTYGEPGPRESQFKQDQQQNNGGGGMYQEPTFDPSQDIPFAYPVFKREMK